MWVFSALSQSLRTCSPGGHWNRVDQKLSHFDFRQWANARPEFGFPSAKTCGPKTADFTMTFDLSANIFRMKRAIDNHRKGISIAKGPIHPQKVNFGPQTAFTVCMMRGARDSCHIATAPRCYMSNCLNCIVSTLNTLHSVHKHVC